jgi:hypothetical protein
MRLGRPIMSWINVGEVYYAVHPVIPTKRAVGCRVEDLARYEWCALDDSNVRPTDS